VTARRMMLATVSGSFHRHMSAIVSAVETLTNLGVHVVSPADPRVVATQGEFLFVASDRTRSVRLVQDRHLECILASDFLWLVCPDGYVGQSASMELGYAVAKDIPIFSDASPADLTLRQYVTRAQSLSSVVDHAIKQRRAVPLPGLLIDPHASIEEAHAILDRIRDGVTEPVSGSGSEVARRVLRDRQTLVDLLSPNPTR